MRTYPNLFLEAGFSEEEIIAKINRTFETMFFDPQERIYFETDGNMGYIMDTGNLDARTEGMSYGMMMAVQMDRQELFDRLWLFSMTHMYQTGGKYEGYFAWSVQPDGTHNAEGPAPDGEEYYAMALFFASRRWGDRQAPFDYSVQANEILRHCVRQHELVKGGQPMWDPGNYLIKFVPETPFTDPSYHLPHFYELFSQYAAEDRAFWRKAAAASREYLQKACHPVTGMASEYAEYDGTPKELFGKKQQFYSDSYRVSMNIGLDASWFGPVRELTGPVDRLQEFFRRSAESGIYDSYLLDGTPVGGAAMHPVAITATIAAGSLAAANPNRIEWVRKFWETPLRKGEKRYYDNCLFFFSLLMLAGKYHIY